MRSRSSRWPYSDKHAWTKIRINLNEDTQIEIFAEMNQKTKHTRTQNTYRKQYSTTRAVMMQITKYRVRVTLHSKLQ